MKTLLKKIKPVVYITEKMYPYLEYVENYTFIEAMVNSLGSGLGFMLAMVMFSGVRSTIEGSDIPESFKGLPITLVAAAITSLSFMGFGGVIENLFS